MTDQFNQAEDVEAGRGAGFEVSGVAMRKSGFLGRLRLSEDGIMIRETISGETVFPKTDSASEKDTVLSETSANHTEQAKGNDDDTASSRRRGIILIVLVVLLLAGLATFLGIWFGGKEKESAPESSPVEEIPESTSPPVVDTPESTTAPISIPIVHVLIHFDANPSEVGWSIVDTTSDAEVATVASGIYTGSETFVDEEVEVEWARAYNFTIWDEGGDGTSSGTQGNYTLAYQNSTLAFGEGDWGAKSTVMFRVYESE
eukprot:Nitzschia sp. Nitz4//scaffold268_size26297//22631//23407//NITZ4_008283-RA/size26297-processed-gene-0.14-mRNA-1//-1//CDS//3329544948//5389//frame0